MWCVRVMMMLREQSIKCVKQGSLGQNKRYRGGRTVPPGSGAPLDVTITTNIEVERRPYDSTRSRRDYDYPLPIVRY